MHYRAPSTQKPAGPALMRLRAEAMGALKNRLRGYNSRSRKEWLAEKMGIEERYAIIADMDETECRTVLDLCAEKPSKK